jgi:hypothetical protein
MSEDMKKYHKVVICLYESPPVKPNKAALRVKLALHILRKHRGATVVFILRLQNLALIGCQWYLSTH